MATVERGVDGRWRKVSKEAGGVICVDWKIVPSTDEEKLRHLRERGLDLSAEDLRKARTIFMGEDGPVTVLPGKRVVFYLIEGPVVMTAGSQRATL